MPGSPPTTTSRPRPERASPSAASSTASSRSRPTKTPSVRSPRTGSVSVAAAGISGCRRRNDIEGGILPENRLLELHDHPARLQAELVHQHAPGVLVGLQGLGLAPGAVQGEHQLPAQSLAQRMAGDEGLELGDDLTLTPEREIRLDPLLDDVQVELVEPSDLLLRERVERELGERRAAPEA